jgi:hypothetical protein
MRRYFISARIFVAVGVAVAFVSPPPAGAFVTNANGVAKAATVANTVIDVKRPPGWHHGPQNRLARTPRTPRPGKKTMTPDTGPPIDF